jgi:hypothetical protein
VVELQSVQWSLPAPDGGDSSTEGDASTEAAAAAGAEGGGEAAEGGDSSTKAIAGALCDEELFSTKAVHEHSVCYLVIEPKMGQVTLWHHEHNAFW